MALTLTDRSVVRLHVHSLCEANLAGTGNPMKKYFDHAPTAEEIDGQSPIGWVQSGPTDPNPRSYDQKKQTIFTIVVMHAVRLDGTKDGTWVEARLDLANKKFREFWEDNDIRKIDGKWDNVKTQAQSPGFMDIGGNEYRTEILPLEIEVKD